MSGYGFPEVIPASPTYLDVSPAPPRRPKATLSPKDQEIARLQQELAKLKAAPPKYVADPGVAAAEKKAAEAEKRAERATSTAEREKSRADFMEGRLRDLRAETADYVERADRRAAEAEQQVRDFVEATDDEVTERVEAQIKKVRDELFRSGFDAGQKAKTDETVSTKLRQVKYKVWEEAWKLGWNAAKADRKVRRPSEVELMAAIEAGAVDVAEFDVQKD